MAAIIPHIVRPNIVRDEIQNGGHYIVHCTYLILQFKYHFIAERFHRSVERYFSRSIVANGPTSPDSSV